MYADLQPDEISLAGAWVASGNKVIGDETTLRIEWLIEHRLDRLACDKSGWDTLFRDRQDGRLWERTYPHGEWHGGGPPKLSVITPDAAKSKYKIEDGPMFRFAIRDVPWLAVLVALHCGW